MDRLARSVRGVQHMKRLIPCLVIAALAIAACGETGHIDTTSPPQRPDPAEPATGPVVAAIEVAGTSFKLHDEGAGCVALEVAQPGLQATIERQCFQGPLVVSITSTCGWLTNPDEIRRSDCDVELPEVLYGQVTDPNIGYVCIGTIDDSGGSSGVTAARLLEPIGPGFILEAARPGETPHAHLFTEGGLRYGHPPLDAPSDPIYRLCEGRAPWRESSLEYGAELLVTFADSLQTNDVRLFFNSGLDRIGLNGSAFEEVDDVRIPIRVPESTSGLHIDVETEVGPILLWEYPWPDDFVAILRSGVPCSGLTVIDVTVGSEVHEGSDRAIALGFTNSDCHG